MKNILLIILLTTFSFTSFAQNPHTLFLTYGRSGPEPVFNQRLDGAASYKGVGSNSIGLRYLAGTCKIIAIETGIEYSHFRYKLHGVNMPDVVIPDVTESVDIISVPLYARLSFLKYFFVNGGVLVDAELRKTNPDLDTQTGIGFGIGAGLKYNYRKFHIFVNPYLERHGFWAFKKEEQGTRQSIFNPGGRIGIGYAF